MLVFLVVLAPAFGGGEDEAVAHVGDFARPAPVHIGLRLRGRENAR
jgi:hypothetical protein